MEKKLNSEQGRRLLLLARESLKKKFGAANLPAEPDEPVFRQRLATFVTLKKEGQLRGCIGNLQPVGSLWQGVRDNALNAAFHDRRFSPLSQEELEQVTLDISILSAPTPLYYDDPGELASCLRPGIDGVILRDGKQGATFLPQVWQQLPTPEEFLSQLCRKAGLAPGVWQEKLLTIETYQVQSFHEEGQ